VAKIAAGGEMEVDPPQSSEFHDALAASSNTWLKRINAIMSTGVCDVAHNFAGHELRWQHIP
jgi:hypothetical protein